MLAAQDSFTNEAYGFRIDRPDQAWTFVEAGPTEDAEYALRVSLGEAAVTVYVSTAKASDAKAHADLVAKAFALDKRLSNVTRGSGDPPSVRADYRDGGATYVVDQRYVVRDGRVFTVQAAAPKDDFDQHADALESIRKSFALTTPSEVHRLAAKCGSEIDWAKDWDEAARRAADGKRRVIVVVELYAGLKVEPRAMSSAFMDPDVIALVRERFVGLRLTYGMKAPFQDPAVYGMGPHTFGGGILFVTPDGKVVGECPSFVPSMVLERAGATRAEPKDPALAALRKGDFKRAEDLLKDAKEPEALYHLSEALLMQGDLAAARAIWEKLVEASPDSRWAWKAAASLRGRGTASGEDPVAWPDASVMTALADSPWKTAKADDARRDAVKFLLKQQRDDGSFVTLEHLTAGSGPFTVATAAIAGAALHRLGDAHADRALAFVLAEQKRGALEPSGALFDYAIWAQVFALRFLAAVERTPAVVDAMEEIVDTMQTSQRRGGGWGYFDKDATIGFVTAAAVLALMDARDAGVKVRDDTLDRALDALEALRDEDGTYRYMEGTAAGDPAESSLRGPLYALALKRAGRSDAVRGALDAYLKHRARAIKEKGKTLCHTAPEGTASYYLMFGYAFAAEALRELPEKERAKYADALREDVLALRCEDGGFLDSRVGGRSYATAMALAALR